MHSVTSNAVAIALNNMKIKANTVTGTTNVNGVIYSANSTLTGREFIIWAICTTHLNCYINLGFSIYGSWVQIKEYNGNLLINTSVSVDIIYLEY